MGQTMPTGQVELIAISTGSMGESSRYTKKFFVATNTTLRCLLSKADYALISKQPRSVGGMGRRGDEPYHIYWPDGVDSNANGQHGGQ